MDNDLRHVKLHRYALAVAIAICVFQPLLPQKAFAPEPPAGAMPSDKGGTSSNNQDEPSNFDRSLATVIMGVLFLMGLFVVLVNVMVAVWPASRKWFSKARSNDDE